MTRSATPRNDEDKFPTDRHEQKLAAPGSPRRRLCVPLTWPPLPHGVSDRAGRFSPVTLRRPQRTSGSQSPSRSRRPRCKGSQWQGPQVCIIFGGAQNGSKSLPPHLPCKPIYRF
ncbi:unnamed protein product [Lepidochelys kempii]